VVLGGLVEMRYKDNGSEQLALLNIGDIFHANMANEHVTHPKVKLEF